MIDINNTSQYYHNQSISALVETIAVDEKKREIFISSSNQSISRKFSDLKNIIGDELFNTLSEEDRLFMAETMGSIDFGHAIDLEKISQEIKNNDIL